MAISKLMHMKETAGNPSRHLKRAIEYIMNPEKTNGVTMVNRTVSSLANTKNASG